MSTSAEIHKMAKQPDVFQTETRKWVESSAGNPKVVWGILIALVIAGAFIGIYQSRKNSQELAASQLLFTARESLEMGLNATAKKLIPAKEVPQPPTAEQKKNAEKPASKLQDATAEDLAFKKFDVEAELGTAISKLKEVSDKYSSTYSGFESQMLLGDLYFDHGDANAAVAWFEKATHSAPSAIHSAFAWLDLAYSYEQIGKKNEAAAAFEKATKSKEGAVMGDALMGLARVQLGLGKKDLAKATLDRVIKDLEKTEFANKAKAMQTDLN